MILLPNIFSFWSRAADVVPTLDALAASGAAGFCCCWVFDARVAMKDPTMDPVSLAPSISIDG